MGPASTGSGIFPETWASNVPYAAGDLRQVAQAGVLIWLPGSTIRGLPPDGLVIEASSAKQGPALHRNPNFPVRTLPLQMSGAQVLKSWEGQIASNIPEYRWWVTVDQQQLDVRAYFGTLDPSAATLAAAQQELDRMVVPDVDGTMAA